VGTDSFTVTKTTGAYNSKDVTTAVATTSLASGGLPGMGTAASNYVLLTTASGAGITVDADGRDHQQSDRRMTAISIRH
jgi:hypothetical protein